MTITTVVSECLHLFSLCEKIFRSISHVSLSIYFYSIAAICIRLARRARQFYRMRETTLCDICEGADCSDTCEIRASQQRSAKSLFDEEETARVMETSHANITSGSIFILVASCILTYLTL